MQKNIKFDCHKCGTSFIATPQEYKTVFWYGDIIKEGYCPVCGAVIQINTTRLNDNFSSSGGGKF